MDVDFQLPEDYEPLEEYILCSNTIKNSKYFLSDNGFIPILIGKGEGKTPRIWLYAKDPKLRIIEVVEDNIANLKQVKFDHHQKKKRIVISLLDKDITILDLYYEDIPNVKTLNLKPFGYDIEGDENGLKIGGLDIKNNNFNNLETVIGVGDNDNSTSKKGPL